MTADLRPIVLHTSWRGRLVQLSAPTILFGVAAAGFVVAGEARPVPVVFAAVGVVILLIQLVDYPIVTVFDETGIERRCLLRRARLSWDDIWSIARPGRLVSGTTNAIRRFAGGASEARSNLGLVAEVGEKRRRHLLVDRIESRTEHDELDRAMRVWAPDVPMRASRPPEGISPTFLHKRRRGGPDSLPVDRL